MPTRLGDNDTMTWQKILMAVLTLFSVAFMFAAPNFGERPDIDLYKVPDSAIEEGRIHIKLGELHGKLAQNYSFEDGQLRQFGIESLDALNQQFGVSRITPLFGDIKQNKKWGWRHVEWGFHLWFQLEFKSETDIRDMVTAYCALEKDVEWAEPGYKKILHAMSEEVIASIKGTLERWTPNDPRFDEQWHYHNTGQVGGSPDCDIDLPEAWEIETGHPDVIVAIIDQGVQTDHPDLAANMWVNPGEIPGNGIDDDGNGYIDDVHGYNFAHNWHEIVPGDHGCHTAGTVAAVNSNGIGVAGVAGGSGSGDGVRLMSCQVYAGGSSSGGHHIAPVYAADNGAAISQNSWSYNAVNVYEHYVLDAIDYFNANGGGNVMNGGVSIFSAGNNNLEGYWYPGCYENVFSVAATNNKDKRPVYSNYGTWVDISAPGGEFVTSLEEGILSCNRNGAYAFNQGTSMACPHVSGVAALVVSNAHRNGRTLRNDELLQILTDTADDIYHLNPSYVGKLGSGRINAHSALLAINYNQPQCFITNPADGQFINHGSLVNVEANASSAGGNITNVEFHLNGVLKATVTTSPFTWLWDTSSEPGGKHILTVKATDGNSNSSSHTISIILFMPPDEDFETQDFSQHPWQNTSPIPWTVPWTDTPFGSYAAKSGAIGNGSSSILSLQMTVSQAGNISFFYRVSSEQDSDWLRFHIDGEPVDQWSGPTRWEYAEFPVSSGLHTFSWVYQKNLSGASGDDCAWIDYIKLPPGGTYLFPPRNLTQTSGNAVVSLAWQEPLEGGPTGYRIYRDGEAIATQFSLEFQDRSVENENTYDYVVTALYGPNESEASNVVTGYPTSTPTVAIIIGDGTRTQNFPLNRNFLYSSHEAIYLASQIGTPCTIGSIAFQKSSGADVDPIQNVQIYMKHTSLSSLATGAYSLEGYDLVYDGNFLNNGLSGWMEAQLDTPFEYDGASNLSILTLKGSQNWSDNPPLWTYTVTSGTQARQNSSDSSLPASLAASTNLPNLKILAVLPADLLQPAQNLKAFAGNHKVELSWHPALSGVPGAYKIYRDGTLLNSISGLAYTDFNVENGTSYSYYVVASYPQGDAMPTFTVQVAPDEYSFVELGSGTTSSGVSVSCPINVFYPSLHGQSVYTKTELNNAGVFGPITIEEIGFNVTGIPALAMPNYVVRMGHTTAINTSTWTPASSLNEVWNSSSYRPTHTGWNMLPLSSPFVWNGEDNIVVDTAFSPIGSWNPSGTTQYTSVTSGYRFVVAEGSDQTNVFAGGSTSNYRPNLRLAMLAPEPQAPQILITPLSLDFGTVVPGMEKVLQFTIQNIGNDVLSGSIVAPDPFTASEHVSSDSFEIRNNLYYSLNAGDSRDYDLSFSPQESCSYTGDLVIVSNADQSPVIIALSGIGAFMGLDTPELNVVKSVNGVTLSWDNVENADFYQIYRAVEPYGDFILMDTTTNLYFEDSEPLPRAFYRVMAITAE